LKIRRIMKKKYDVRSVTPNLNFEEYRAPGESSGPVKALSPNLRWFKEYSRFIAVGNKGKITYFNYKPVKS
jgi:hypothetical protein